MWQLFLWDVIVVLFLFSLGNVNKQKHACIDSKRADAVYQVL